MAQNEIPGFSLEWNFDYMVLCNPNYLQNDVSYEFSLPQLNNTNWSLQISSKLIGRSAFITQLQRKGNDDGPFEVEIVANICGLLVGEKTENRGTKIKTFQKTKFKKNEKSKNIIFYASEFSNIFDVFTLDDGELDKLSEFESVRNGSFKFHFRLWSRNYPLMQPIKYIVKSKSEDVRSFIWSINDCLNLKKGQNVKYVLNSSVRSESQLTFELYLNEDPSQETLGIRIDCNNPLSLVCIISILDVKGRKLFISKSDVRHNFIIPNDVWDQPSAICKQKLLRERQRFLPNDQLTLQFTIWEDLGVSISSTTVLQRVIVGDYHENISENKTLRPVTNDQTQQNIKECSLHFKLYQLYLEGTFTDLSLNVGPKCIAVHKNVLCARSAVFKAMLTSDMCESKNSKVEILDVDLDTMKHMLHYMYLDTTLDMDWESATRLYVASDKYEVFLLKKECIEFLISELNSQNICKLLSLADMHADDDLRSASHDFILRHKLEIFQSKDWKALMKTNPQLTSDTMFAIILK